MKKLLASITSLITLFASTPVDARITVSYQGREKNCPGLYTFEAQELSPDPQRLMGGIIFAGTYRNTMRCYKADLADAEKLRKQGLGRGVYGHPAHISFLKYDILDSEDAIRYISQVTGIPRKNLFFTGP